MFLFTNTAQGATVPAEVGQSSVNHLIIGVDKWLRSSSIALLFFGVLNVVNAARRSARTWSCSSLDDMVSDINGTKYAPNCLITISCKSSLTSLLGIGCENVMVRLCLPVPCKSK